jgi:hypothetical protein
MEWHGMAGHGRVRSGEGVRSANQGRGSGVLRPGEEGQGLTGAREVRIKVRGSARRAMARPGSLR